MHSCSFVFSVKTLLILAGSYVSFGIGAGFATGAELLQFWAPHGSNAIFGLIICAALILFLQFRLIRSADEPGDEVGFLSGSCVFHLCDRI